MTMAAPPDSHSQEGEEGTATDDVRKESPAQTVEKPIDKPLDFTSNGDTLAIPPQPHVIAAEADPRRGSAAQKEKAQEVPQAAQDKPKVGSPSLSSRFDDTELTAEASPGLGH